LLALAFLIWFQARILPWNYGALNGLKIAWSHKTFYGWIDTPVWALILALAAVLRNHGRRIIRVAGSWLFLSQLVFFLLFPPRTGSNADFYWVNDSRRADFSRQRNVIILVLDSFRGDIFSALLTEHPDLRTRLGGFTFFPDALGGFPYTAPSVPVILTGSFYDNRQPFSRYLETSFRFHSLPERLQKNGFRVEMYPLDSSGVYLDPAVCSNILSRRLNPLRLAFLYDLALFCSLPHPLKKMAYASQRRLISRPFSGRASASVKRNKRAKPRPAAGATIQDVPGAEGRFVWEVENRSTFDATQPVFKYLHFQGMHPMLRLDSECRYRKMAYSESSYKAQAYCLLRLADRFLAFLEKRNLLACSLVYIIGDHGSRLFPMTGQDLYADEDLSGEDLLACAQPLVLAKPLGIGRQRPLLVSKAPISLADIADSVLNELRLPTFGSQETIFAKDEATARSRRFFFYRNFDNLANDYLADVIEYRVCGPVWDKHSWSAVGTDLPPGNR